MAPCIASTPGLPHVILKPRLGLPRFSNVFRLRIIKTRTERGRPGTEATAGIRLVWFPDPSLFNLMREGEGRVWALARALEFYQRTGNAILKWLLNHNNYTYIQQLHTVLYNLKK